MSRLVKARIKRPEHMPDWACACMKAYSGKEMVVDVHRIRAFPAGPCDTCGVELPVDMAVYAKNDGAHWPIDILDLDEGPLEAA